ncbi:hypothetical protein REPUB_Repub08aG0183800 [Reevesia pubescens]
MTVLFWNCRGAGSTSFLSHVKELIRLHNVEILVVAEPRISGLAADKVIRKLRFNGHTKIDAIGFSGGIWILWKSTIGQVQVFDKFEQGITLFIDNGSGVKWVFSAIYASHSPSLRESLWNYLTNMDRLDNLPWLRMGDFNQVLASSEKQGGIPESSRRMKLFRVVLHARKLIDMEATGCRFTWSNNHPLSGLIKKKLDRSLCNELWRLAFPDACVRNLPRVKSDHCPILVSLQTSLPVNKIARPFRFELAWLSHTSFAKLLKDNWVEDTSLHIMLCRWQGILKQWNMDVFGNVFRKKRRLLARLGEICILKMVILCVVFLCVHGIEWVLVKIKS